MNRIPCTDAADKRYLRNATSSGGKAVEPCRSGHSQANARFGLQTIHWIVCCCGIGRNLKGNAKHVPRELALKGRQTANSAHTVQYLPHDFYPAVEEAELEENEVAPHQVASL
jgi:hypothetical protein